MTRQREMNLEFSPLKTGDHRVPRPRQWYPWPTHPHYPVRLYLNQRSPTCPAWECRRAQDFLKGEEKEKRKKRWRARWGRKKQEWQLPPQELLTVATWFSQQELPYLLLLRPPKTACPFPAPLPNPTAPATPPGSSSWYPSSLFECNCIQEPFPHPRPLSCSSPFFLATSSLPSHPLFPSCWWRTRDLTQVSLPRSVT